MGAGVRWERVGCHCRRCWGVRGRGRRWAAVEVKFVDELVRRGWELLLIESDCDFWGMLDFEQGFVQWVKWRD